MNKLAHIQKTNDDNQNNELEMITPEVIFGFKSTLKKLMVHERESFANYLCSRFFNNDSVEMRQRIGMEF